MAADSGTDGPRVADFWDGIGPGVWEALEKCRIIGHDGIYARLVCPLCPIQGQYVYGVRGSVAGLVRWFVQHYGLKHGTQADLARVINQQ